MDKNALADKVILRYLGKCSEVANLDRRVCLCIRGHRQEAPQPVSQLVRNATDSQPQPVRENPLDTALSTIALAQESTDDGKQLILFN